MEKNTMKRRDMIGMGAATAAALSLGTSASASEKECGPNCQCPKCQAKKAQKAKNCCSKGEGKCCSKSKPKIGLILYTLRDYLKTESDIARTFERIKKIGYDAVEITSCGAVSNKKLAELLKQNELKAISTHASFDAMVKEPQKVIDEHHEIGAGGLGVGSMPGSYERSAQGFTEFAKAASEVGATMLEAGLPFVYHNHSFEFEHYEGRPAQEILRSVACPKAFQFEIDTYWVQHGGADPAEWIQKLTGRVRLVHMKDMIIHEGKQIFAPVGAGNLNWPAILKACCTAGTEYCITEQDRCIRDPFEAITISLNNMKSWGLV